MSKGVHNAGASTHTRVGWDALQGGLQLCISPTFCLGSRDGGGCNIPGLGPHKRFMCYNLTGSMEKPAEK